MKKDVCRTDWGTRFVTWISMLCARVGVQVGAWMGLLMLVAPMQVLAVGWTPTGGGLVVNLKPDDKILISVMVDHDNNPATPDREYFVENYTRYTGDGYFTYDTASYYLKLVPQKEGATEPSEMSIWTVDSALTRVDEKNWAGGGAGKDYALGGIAYTIWNDNRTLKTYNNDRFKFFGDLEKNSNNDKLCDVVFVIPTNHESITSFDPNNTMGRGTKFNGETGRGFLGMTYREVYWLEIPRFNNPVCYTNAALVTFNTTKSNQTWGGNTIKSGRAAYAYADDKHKGTKRTIFRLYILNEPFVTCPDSYFFAYNEQDFLKYREGPSTIVTPPKTWADSTAKKKVYTMDRLFRMERVDGTATYQTGLMNVPVSDSAYYYVGWHDDYRNGSGGSPSEPLGSSTAASAFTKIRELPMKSLAGKIAPAGSCGRMIVDTTVSGNNLNVKFEPAGYFLQVTTPVGFTNVPMKKTGENEWTCEDMWTIQEKWGSYTIKATTYTCPTFQANDPGADIAGWSVDVAGTAVPVQGSSENAVGKSGWARIYTNNTNTNGGMVFVLADATKRIHYDNNGFLGMQIPDQYPVQDGNTVVIEAPRIKSDYTFTGWNTAADGSGTAYAEGSTYTFSGADSVTLYAQGTYKGTYNVALSFKKADGKRYFLTHPGTAAPRYARARYYDDWTNVWQGMANAENVDSLYLNSFELRHPSNEVKAYQAEITEGDRRLEDREFVLDPRHYKMKGAVDSLTFYEYFMPPKDEYLGLYYVPGLNTILANNTWAGLFKSTSNATPTGWPDYKLPYIHSTKLYSERYVVEEDPEGHPDSLKLKIRANNSEGTYVKYIPETNQFDGVLSEEDATEFQLTAIVVADEHYVVLPDTTESWRDEIVFDKITDPHPQERVWSKLIGKQLLACMMVDGDTTYFHPNRDKIYTNATALRQSPDFRLTQNFTFIPDRRVQSLSEENRARMEDADNEFGRIIVGGRENPKNVSYEGQYIDIIDTLRISLTQGGVSKIKEYRGRWKKKDASDGLTVKGSTRYRDILVRTKTYHYGDITPHLVLTPEFDSYTFNPLAGNNQTINFTLTKVTSRPIIDAAGNTVDEEVFDTEDVTSSLQLGPSACGFTSGGSHFSIPEGGAVSNRVTLQTTSLNKTDVIRDTLIITMNVTIDAVSYPATVRVPLTQTSLEGDELIWSVKIEKQRYYIMAGTGGLIFRKYKQSGNTLYKENTSTHLVKGSANPENNDAKYITPWRFRYNPENANQLSLKTESGVNRYLKFSSEEVGTRADIHASDSSFISFEYEQVYTNSNANEEEQVKLKYGSGSWLKLSVDGSGPYLELVGSKEDATVFSWSYLQREYSLLNNGTYPDRDLVTFGYNTNMSVNVKTRYKAYKEFSMLVDNSVVYCCREDENDIADLKASGQEWKTDYTITRIADARDFDGDDDPTSGLSITTTESTLTTSVSTSGTPTSPTNVMIGGKYVDIVDTLHVALSLQPGAPAYRFKDKWSSYKSVSDAELKIPLIRKTYHVEDYDSLVCLVAGDEYNYTFPNTITDPVSHVFTLGTKRRTGQHVLDVDNASVAVLDATTIDVSGGMHLDNKAMAEVRLMDEFGNTPDWCQISDKGTNTITVQCTKSGIRSPRIAFIYIAYIVMIDHDGDSATEEKMRFVNFRLTVSQPSLFVYANNQHLVHNRGASGDELDSKGMQQVHENKRILYYYPDQNVELPVRESHFFGWWRWFREGDGEIGDSDIPDTEWRTPPSNTGGKYVYPFRIIGDSVWIAENDHNQGKKLVTMGRYTVFHYRSKDYPDVRNNPPAKTALVAPPTATAGIATKPTVTYAVDISNYYDKLPMSVSQKNQVDTARLDTMKAIPEPTLSLREVFELHPWTEMAARLDGFKSERTVDDTGEYEGEYELASERYMEDHVTMAPLGNQLLLSTEQRYNYNNLVKGGHSESLLGYYMRDDKWSTMSSDADGDGWSRQDSMIWCGGWDADCLWYTYDPKTKKYTRCTHKITEGDDFLIVPKKENITAGYEFDTVYYCLRARSWKTPIDNDESVPGDYMFNICRYMIIYHQPTKYGPLVETGGKSIITNDEIEQRYEVLERLNFDYNKPGDSYTVYPHPLHWADASYGYTYPETPSLPHNRLHDQTDFPNMGEYGLINRIPYSNYWYTMEQHGGAANGYMIYCDGMSSSGQVAALSLNTTLCSGQKMFFSCYVGNPSNQSNKANPNFTISVQGSEDGSSWDNITSYMTGDIKPSRQWYQIYFPILFTSAKAYTHFRVSIYNMSSNWDGNDFILDDMCIFATKPPLIAYQANTVCKEQGEEDKPTNIILRLDYQGIISEGYNDQDLFYTVKCDHTGGGTSFVEMEDGYLNQETHTKKDETKPDTIIGKLHVPSKTYEPSDADSIYVNMNELIGRFETSMAAHEADGVTPIVREGYIYEILEGDIRPVKYVVHCANLVPTDTFTVHMSAEYSELMSSICGMTSYLKVSNRMVLELNGEEQVGTEQTGLCANSTYDIGLRVKGSLYLDSVAPIDLDGTCKSDWLLYGDTAEAKSLARYGYKYSDIVKVVKDILRCDPPRATNRNQFARNLAGVSRNEMQRIQEEQEVELSVKTHPYDILADLVNKGLLMLYQQNVTATTYVGDSVQFVIFPILGTGSDAMHHANVDVCPLPILIKLKPNPASAKAPLIIQGIGRSASELNQPVVVLANATNSTTEISLKVDSIMPNVGIRSVQLLSTDDPDFREGIHSLSFVPNLDYPAETYYVKGDNIILSPASTNNYYMKQGYSYTFGLEMQTNLGKDTLDGGCKVGTVPFSLAIVPDYVRWAPQNETSNKWNNPNNWIGVNQWNQPIQSNARFAPLPSTNVIIPTMTDGRPYPEIPATIAPEDSIKQVGFVYNTCNAIRLMPGAALGQQQRMTISAAIIDMSLPNDKWALRSAPVKGMLSGDLFMAQADLNGTNTPWEVGAFDASGRNYTTGNATYWLSLYSSQSVHYGNTEKNDTFPATTEWSPVTNGMTLSLPPASGWAVYALTKSGRDAAVRLPKNDDIYYYYTRSGNISYDHYEHNLCDKRDELAGGAGEAGKLAFQPTDGAQTYRLTNGAASTSFVFGNPTLAFIDIWGFIADNAGLSAKFDYINTSGHYVTISRDAVEGRDTITNQQRYLPPMHAIVLKAAASGTTLNVTLNTNRVVTSHRQVVGNPLAAPLRGGNGKSKGIMTVTAINPVADICTSRLLLGQGYHRAIRDGEDAVLTTINVEQFNSSTPSTPFNIYASEGNYGLCIDLRDEILNVPISFFMSELSFGPITQLWFTGVNNIDGPLVLYDAWTNTERRILDGICLNIETPTQSHLARYYIRLQGYTPEDDSNNPIATGVELFEMDGEEAVKIIQDGHVLILRNGEVYTMLGQKVERRVK